MNTLIDLFKSFEHRGDKVAFVNRNGVRRLVYSYREISLLSLKMAGLLEGHGVRSGERVLIWGPNSPWWAIAFWGVIVRRGVAVPVDFMSDRQRAESINEHSEAKFI